MSFLGVSKAKQAEVIGVIIRADGSREELGVIAYHSRNPLKRAIFKIKKWFGITVSSSIKTKCD